MRRITFVACLMFLALVPAASGQDWKEFRSREDGFGINFPGDPVVTEVRWYPNTAPTCRRASTPQSEGRPPTR